MPTPAREARKESAGFGIHAHVRLWFRRRLAEWIALGLVVVEAAPASAATVGRAIQAQHEGIDQAPGEGMPYIRATAAWTANFFVSVHFITLYARVAPNRKCCRNTRHRNSC